jgi:hypothetical protein
MYGNFDKRRMSAEEVAPYIPAWRFLSIIQRDTRSEDVVFNKEIP